MKSNPNENRYFKPYLPEVAPRVLIPLTKYTLDLKALNENLLESFKDQKLRDLEDGEKYGVIIRVRHSLTDDFKTYRGYFTNQEDLDKVLLEEDHSDYILKDFDGKASKSSKKDKYKERDVRITDGFGRLVEYKHMYEDVLLYHEKYGYEEDGSIGTYIYFSNGRSEYRFYDAKEETITKYVNNKLVKVCYGCKEDNENKCNYFVNYTDEKITSIGFNSDYVEFSMYVNERIKF